MPRHTPDSCMVLGCLGVGGSGNHSHLRSHLRSCERRCEATRQELRPPHTRLQQHARCRFPRPRFPRRHGGRLRARAHRRRRPRRADARAEPRQARGRRQGLRSQHAAAREKARSSTRDARPPALAHRAAAAAKLSLPPASPSLSHLVRLGGHGVRPQAADELVPLCCPSGASRQSIAAAQRDREEPPTSALHGVNV